MVLWERFPLRMRKLTTFDTSSYTVENIPPGWTRHRRVQNQEYKTWSHWEFEPERQHIMGLHFLHPPDFFYTHESDPKAEFWILVPIRDRSVPPLLHTPMPLLSCAAERGWFRLGQRIDRYKTISLHTSSGE
ncbi:hypothetical protein B0J14DRAFT_96326 [Halenospora varia]|nr:hypothetical protein B0J14DRAFT_96326 [Halenospora varia]